MNRLKEFLIDNRAALLCSILYVGFGTLSVCSVYPADMFFGGWVMYGILVTFPVTIISFGFRYAEARDLIPVLVIQFAMLILAFFAAKAFFDRKK